MPAVRERVVIDTNVFVSGLLSTQSPAILDEFEPEEIVVAERRGGETSLRRLVPAELEAWLAEYSLSELYDKNVLGGRP